MLPKKLQIVQEGSTLFYMNTDTVIDMAIAELDKWDHAERLFEGSSAEREAFQKWIADNLPEVASGESVYTDLTFDTYAASSDWADDAMEAYEAYLLRRTEP
jgi:hypothetical protein